MKPERDVMQTSPISTESILDQLNKILSSSLFANAEQSRALLKFVVEQAVNERTDRLKEYTVGAEGLGRGGSFDPRTDTIVRAEASRLRSRLERYYADEGTNDLVEITLPKGNYVPQFQNRKTEWSSPEEATVNTAGLDPARSRSRWKRLRPWAISLFTIVVALFLFFVGLLILKHRSKPADFHSVVLLPLTNLSGDSSQDYLSDGVTDELITELAQATGVPVISRTSAMVYKGKQKPMPVIARELGVDAVVEGALKRTGDRLRMTVHLIDGARDKSLWAQSYDGDMSNVRALEIKVAADLAAHLRAPATTRPPIGSLRPIAPEAYEEYLKGQYLWGRFENWQALRHFERAAAIDPDYAAAYGGIAKTYCRLEYAQALPSDIAFAQASNAVEKAFSLDKQNAEAHAAHAYVLIYRDWNWREAEAELQRAIAIDPSNSFIYRWYSSLLLRKGRKADSFKQAQLSARLDPVSVQSIITYGDRLLLVGNFKESIEQFRAAIELDPAGSRWRFSVAEALEKSGQLDRAATELGEAYIVRGEPDIAAEFKRQYPVSGYTKAATEAQRVHLHREIQKLEDKRAKGEYVSPTAYTNIYAGLENREETLRWLDEACRQHSNAAVELLDERFDFIRHDPHFESIFRSIPFYH
jgi:TolB-like protein/Tfp pilus assembly protein PilF